MAAEIAVMSKIALKKCASPGIRENMALSTNPERVGWFKLVAFILFKLSELGQQVALIVSALIVLFE